MNKLTLSLLIFSLANLGVWLSGMFNSMVSGFCLALSGVFYILTFITYIIGKAEAEEVPSNL